MRDRNDYLKLTYLPMRYKYKLKMRRQKQTKNIFT